MKRLIAGVLVIVLTITFSVIALASNGEKTAKPSLTKFINVSILKDYFHEI